MDDAKAVCTAMAEWFRGEMGLDDEENQLREAIASAASRVVYETLKMHGSLASTEADDNLYSSISAILVETAAKTIYSLFFEEYEDRVGALDFELRDLDEGESIILRVLNADDELKRINITSLITAQVDGWARVEKSFKGRRSQLNRTLIPARKSLMAMVDYIDQAIASLDQPDK